MNSIEAPHSETNLFSGQIRNCFDSHVHWRATGQFSRKLNLKNLRAETEALELQPIDENYFGDWLVGFGWDQNLFFNQQYPSREVLDKRFGETPVYFTRIDGHAAWVNTAAMKKADLWQKNIVSRDGGKIFLDADGYPTGIFIDLAMNPFLSLIQQHTHTSIKADLISGQAAFHRAGFTHIRDLTCDDEQWAAEFELMQQGQLLLAVEQFFSADEPNDFHKRLRLAVAARKLCQTLNRPPLLRPKGVKVYYDGALGSEGALLSRPYLTGSGNGLQLLEDSILKEMMIECSSNDVDLAVHTIGDEAAHRVTNIAYDLKKKNISLRLHLEHAELLRLDTIELLKQIDVVCHLQPCHWLSDKKWLKKKIGPLTEHAFRWYELESKNIKFDFGSDSPIEPTSMQTNYSAIQDAEKNGILPPVKSFAQYHEHTDPLWCPQTSTTFVDGRPKSLTFFGEQIWPVSGL